MSFSNKQILRYLSNKFQYYILISYIKALLILKCQQFENSKSNTTELWPLKYSYMDMHDNKKDQGLKKYLVKCGKYVFFFFCT